MFNKRTVACLVATALISGCTSPEDDSQATGWEMNESGGAFVKAKGSEISLVYEPKDADKAEGIFLEWKDANCTEVKELNDLKLKEESWKVNGTYVKFLSACPVKRGGVRVKGTRMAATTTDEGEKYLFGQLLSRWSDEVSINGSVFPLKGFKTIYDHLSVTNYENAL